jgi:hypothetical protein
MKCPEASEQLIDLLYGELSTEARQKLEAHLAQCPACAAEAKSLGQTAQVARAALAGPLSEEPPARVRASILQTATAAVPRHQPAPEAQGGWLSRWLRLPWLFPAVGAFGVAAVILLVKVVKDPQLPAPTIAASESTESIESAPAPVASPELVPASPPSSAQPSSIVRTAPPEPAEPRAEKAKRAAAKPAPAKAALRQHETPEGAMAMDVLADRGRGAGAVSPPAARPSTEAEGLGSLAGRADERRHESNAPAPIAAAPTRLYAVPPPAPAPAPAKSAPAPAAPAALPPMPKPTAVASETPAAARGAKRMVKDDAAKPQAAAAFDDELAAAESALAAAESADKTDKNAEASPRREAKGGVDLNDRIRAADRLFAEKRWAEALFAYRALLLRAPDHVLARTWRERVTVAEHAQPELSKPAAAPSPPR